MDDEELDRLIRAANPARTAPDAAPDHSLMRRILTEPNPRHGRRLPIFVTSIAAAVVFGLALVVLNPVGQPPATAYGPAPLKWTPMQQTPEEVTRMAHERLSSSGGPGAAQRQSTSTSWSLSVDEAGEPGQVTSISPLVTELVWSDDLSGRRLVTAGAPYSVPGGSVPSDVLAEGTVIDDMEFGVGEYPALVPDAGTMDANALRDLLDAYAPLETGAKAGDAMLGVIDVLGEWTLTNAQHGYLLDALLQYDGLELRGTTTDRLGREVVGLRSTAMARPGEDLTMLISATTGRLVGVENTVTGSEASAPVPVGTVIHYALWKDNE